MDENHNDMAERPIPRITPFSDGLMTHSRDWEYSMRREMQEIIPGLFLGPYAAAMKSKLKVLQSSGITHIVCIRQAVEANFIRPNFPQHFSYLVLDICDSPSENIIQHFRPVNNFINGAFASGGKVLVHGNGGISRSAAVVVAYVMQRHSLGFSEAIGVVKNQRFCLSINEGFLRQLMEYEHIYQAEASMKSQEKDVSLSPSGSGTIKRKREADEEEQIQTDEVFSFQNLPANYFKDI